MGRVSEILSNGKNAYLYFSTPVLDQLELKRNLLTYLATQNSVVKISFSLHCVYVCERVYIFKKSFKAICQLFSIRICEQQVIDSTLDFLFLL